MILFSQLNSALILKLTSKDTLTLVKYSFGKTDLVFILTATQIKSSRRYRKTKDINNPELPKITMLTT